MLSLIPILALAQAFAIGCGASVVPVTPRASPGTPMSRLVPKTNVSMAWSDLNRTDVTVAASMKLPSVMLEHINTLTSVDCSPKGVVLKYNNSADYAMTLDMWPKSDFILITNHLGDCDAEFERGIFVVDDVVGHNKTLTITAKANKTVIHEQLGYASIQFNSTASPSSLSKRGSQTVSADLSGATLVSTDALSIVANKAHLDATVGVSGNIDYSFWELSLKDAWVEINYSHNLHMNVSAAITASVSDTPFSFTPQDLTISAFEIPGIISLGPALSFGAGVELSATGTTKVTVDYTTVIASAYAKVDLKDKTKSSAKGWDAQTTLNTLVQEKIDLQANPFASLKLEIACNVFSGLLDLSSGIEAKPEIINDFATELDVTFASKSGVSLAAPSSSTCPNGAWFASTFHFELDAFVTQFYTQKLYSVDVPIYKSQCWKL